MSSPQTLPAVGSPTTFASGSSRGKFSTSCREFEKKEAVRCLFCGGANCKRCGPDAYKALQYPAFDGLHSSWISDDILGMQRPNDHLFDNCGLLKAFNEKKITAVFNLCEPGEHPYCGYPLLKSGFPYSPEKIMAAGIKHINLCWPDMTVPPLKLMLNIVQIAIREMMDGGRIAVHCHAGFGRTGLTIGCIMIAKDLVQSAQVIQFIRNRRPGSIQTQAQQDFVSFFERSYFEKMQVFPLKLKHEPNRAKAEVTLRKKTISESVEDMHFFLTKEEITKVQYRWVHKLVVLAVDALKKLALEDVYICSLAFTGLSKLILKAPSTQREEGSALSRINSARIGVSPEQELTAFVQQRSQTALRASMRGKETDPSPDATANGSLPAKADPSAGADDTAAASTVDIETRLRSRSNSSGTAPNAKSPTTSAIPVVMCIEENGGIDFSTAVSDYSNRTGQDHSIGPGLPAGGLSIPPSISASSSRRSSFQNGGIVGSPMSNDSGTSGSSNSHRSPLHPTAPMNSKTRRGSQNSSLLQLPSISSREGSRRPSVQKTPRICSNDIASGNISALLQKAAPLESFTVVMNSITDGTEEGIVNDLKLELNANNYNRLTQISGVVGSSLKIKDMGTSERVMKNATLTPSGDNSKDNSMSYLKGADSSSGDANSLAPTPPGSSISRRSDPNNAVIEKLHQAHQLAQKLTQELKVMQQLDDEEEGSNKLLVAASSEEMPMRSPLLSKRNSSKKLLAVSMRKLGSFKEQPTAKDQFVEADQAVSSTFAKPVGRSLSMKFKRQSSLKQNSEADYEKSKKVSSNLLAQIFLDWIETRLEPLFPLAVQNKLKEMWEEEEDFYKEPIGYGTDFTTSPELQQFAEKLGEQLEQTLSRCSIALFEVVMDLYRTMRYAGRRENDGTTPPIDVLVAVRFSIAMVLGRKENSSLVKSRALNLDVVKVFLTKKAARGVVINNITFNEDNYLNVKTNLGSDLIDRVYAVTRTLQLLMESDWSMAKSTTRMKNKVHWNAVRAGLAEEVTSFRKSNFPHVAPADIK